MQKFLRLFVLMAMFALPFASNAQTDCTSLSIPYAENFDGYTGNATSTSSPTGYPAITLPNCWSFLHMSSTTSTYPQVFLSSSSSYAASGNCLFFKSSKDSALFAVMPAISSSDALLLSFTYRNEGITAYNGTILVGYMTDATDATTFVALDSCDRTTTKTVKEVTVPAGTLSNGARLAFMYRGGTSNNYYASIDNVLLDVVPTCFKVDGLAVVDSLTTSSSITLTWVDTVNSGATYTIYNMADTTVAASAVTGAPYTVTGLTANTLYSFAVMTDCGGGDVSYLTMPVSERTACDAMALPWTCGFEASEIQSTTQATALPWCSQRFISNVSSPNYPYSYNSSTYAHGGSYSLYYFGTTSSSYPDTMAFVLPQVDVTTYPMNANRVTFWARMSSTSYNKNVYVCTMSDLTDMSTLTIVDSVMISGTTHTKYAVSLSAANANDSYVVLAVVKGSGSLYLDDLTLEEQPSCVEVASVVASNVTSSGMTLTWTDASNSSATYTIYNMADTTVVVTGISALTYDITDLTSNTDYTFGVQANCGSDDAVIVTVNAHTACAAMPLPFTENFSSTLSSDHCWRGANILYADGVQVNMGNPTNWTYASSTSNGLDAGHYRVNIYGTSCYKWLITPEIDLTDASSPLLTFDAAFTVFTSSSDSPATGFENNTSQKFMVLVSTNNGQTWTVTSDIPLTSLASSTYLTQYVNLSSYAGDTIRLAFYAQSTTSGGDNNLHIDNISIDEFSGTLCLPVSNLTVSNISTDEATLTWNGDADGYTVYQLTATDTTVYQYAVDTTVTLYALDPMTNYTFGVTSNCGTDESSMVTVTFNTACTAMTLPYTENFEANSGTLTCWSTDGPGSWNIATGDYNSTTGAFSGNTNATIQHSNTGDVTKLISPALDLDGANGVQLVYAHIQRSWTGDQDEMRVYYRTSDSTAWIQAAEYTNEISSWTVDNVMLPATTYQVAFEMTDGWGYGVAIDSVVFNPIASDFCAPVAALTVDSVSTTDVYLSWISDANDFTVVDMATGNVVATSSVNTATVTGLTSGTAYTFGVVVDCGSTTSDTVTIAAMTQCENTCQITIAATDGYGDGWNNAVLTISQNGMTMATYSMAGQGVSSTTIFDTFQVTVCSGMPVSFSWTSGTYDDEIGFDIIDGGNSVVYTVTDASTLTGGAVLYTLNDACPSCAAPIVSVDAVTTTSVTISWTGNASNYSIYNGGTYVANVTANTYTFSGLTAGTAYTFGIVAICSADDSSSMATINATTEFDCADITTLPYNYGFEPGLGCWTTVNGSTDGVAWFTTNCAGLSTVTPHSGSLVASSWSWNSTAMHANAWLISPKFVLPTVAAGDSLTFSWWEAANANYADSYSVKISTTTADTSAFTVTARPSTAAAGSWTMQSIDLTSYAGQSVYIAFHHVDYDNNYLLIDDISLYQGTYVAPDPDTLTVTVATMDATMGTTNPAPGTYQYAETETVYLSAIANPGYHFIGWAYTDGIDSDTLGEDYISLSFPANVFISEGSVTFTALFEAGNPDSTTVTYAVNDATMGTTIPAPGTYVAYVGSEVVAQAIPNNGYQLDAWILEINMNGSVIQSDTLNADSANFTNPINAGSIPQSFADYGATITLMAVFGIDTTGSTDEVFTLITAVNDATLGTITPAPGTHTYNAGESINFGFTPAEGYTIGSVDMTMSYMGITIMDTTLSGLYAIALAQEPLPVDDFLGFTMSLTVNFVADTNSNSDVFTLVTAVNDATMGTMTPAPGTYTYNTGDIINFSVTPNEGYAFQSATIAISYMGMTVQEETFTDLEFTTEPMPVTEEMLGYTMTVTVNFVATQGIEDADEVNINAYSQNGNVVLSGAEGREVYLFDINGRMLHHTQTANHTEVYSVPANGVYLIKVAGAQTKRVVVIR